MRMDTVLQGRLTADPELTFTNKGIALAKFTVAVNRKKGDEDYASFFDCTIWNDQAKNLCASLKKGDLVVVLGNLAQERWEKDGKQNSKIVINATKVAADLTFKVASMSEPESTGKTVEADF